VLFAFRGIRGFQVLLALIALACGLGSAVTLKVFIDRDDAWSLIPAVVLGLVFLWMFGMAVRAPTSFVAVADERTRIRFAGFLDTVVANNDIRAVRIAKHPIWGGVGVRTDFSGMVALVTVWGPVAELELATPVRVWLIPRVWRIRARVLRLSIRHPEKLVERFAPKK
jgi:hypothetical protein